MTHTYKSIYIKSKHFKQHIQRLYAKDRTIHGDCFDGLRCANDTDMRMYDFALLECEVIAFRI